LELHNFQHFGEHIHWFSSRTPRKALWTPEQIIIRQLCREQESRTRRQEWSERLLHSREVSGTERLDPIELRMEDPIMDLIQVNVNEKVFTPAHNTDLNNNLTYVTVSVEEAEMCSVTWADIQDVLDEEWEIGGLAMSTDAIRGLVADE
jgi:4-oxalocrotonate tautomerase